MLIGAEEKNDQHAPTFSTTSQKGWNRDGDPEHRVTDTGMRQAWKDNQWRLANTEQRESPNRLRWKRRMGRESIMRSILTAWFYH